MTEPPASRPRVVVVEDEPEVRDVIVECLTHAGYEVLPASNGLEGLLLIKHNRPAVVTLDLRMPRLGGLDALPRIRKFDPTIRVVVLTGQIDEDIHDRALRMGAAAVLTKPVVMTELLAAVRGAAALPSGTAPPEAPGPADASRPAAAGHPAVAPRILVVDDDAEIREFLDEFLRSRGYDVRLAGHAADAIRAVVEAPPDVVLLDVDLPDLQGPDVLAPVRVRAPRAAVIMVSGSADTETARRALALGAFDYVTKPIDLDYLAQAVETALAMRALDG